MTEERLAEIERLGASASGTLFLEVRRAAREAAAEVRRLRDENAVQSVALLAAQDRIRFLGENLDRVQYHLQHMAVNRKVEEKP